MVRTQVSVLGMPPTPFIPNKTLEQEVQCFEKMGSGVKTVGLGCNSNKLRRAVL